MALEQNELDTLIDDVARQMTAGEPGASFTSSVLARLESKERPVRSWRPALAGLAAAAAVLLAVLVWRGAVGSRAGSSGGSRPGPSGPGIEAGVKEPAPQLADQTGPKGPTPGSIAQAGPQGPALQIANRPIVNPIPSNIDALTVPSIALERLVAVPLAPMDSLEADPLTIAPLTVAPVVIDGADDSQRRFE